MEKLKQDLIKDVLPESWFENGGEGRIDTRTEAILAVYQSLKVHKTLKGYFKKLREDLSKQIAIETRILLVDDNFLEDIGLDVSVVDPAGQIVVGPANSEEILAALEQKPLHERELPELEDPTQKLQMLDDLQSAFISRAVAAHSNAKQLQAPKVMVLKGESATMQAKTDIRYKTDADGGTTDIERGLALDILPTMQNDDKEVLLKGHMQLVDILETQTHGKGDKAYETPIVQVANIPLHAVVKSGVTVLIEGPEMTTQRKEGEETIKQKQRMLILIKPTVIEQQEIPPKSAIGQLRRR